MLTFGCVVTLAVWERWADAAQFSPSVTVCSYCPVTLCARAPAQLDLEGTGYLSPHVLRDALTRWNSDASDHTVDEMIRCIDADGACTRIRFQPNSQNRPKTGSSLTDACLCVSSSLPPIGRRRSCLAPGIRRCAGKEDAGSTVIGFIISKYLKC